MATSDPACFTESCVVQLPAADVWSRVRTVGLDTLFPSLIRSCVTTKLLPSEVDSVREVVWRSGSTWMARLTTLDDESMTVCWDVDSCRPSTGFKARNDRLRLFPVTFLEGKEVDFVMVEWSVEMSPEIDGEAAAREQQAVRLGLTSLRKALTGLPGLPYSLPELSDDDVALYYGTFPVAFTAVGGTTLAYTDGCLKQGENTAENRAEVNKRMKSVVHQSDEFKTESGEYDHVYVPCIPAVDPIESWDESAVEQLPEVLQVPLVKSETGTVAGIRSGGRSAIIMVGKQAYRAKGCGNYVNGTAGGKDLRFPFPGFPVQKMVKFDWTTGPDEEAVEVRGCAFDHTAKHELMMSGEVNRVLQGQNMLCGIVPAAMWRYDVPEADLPLLPKACVLSKTYGERRLASHLLTGLELLLPHLIDGKTDTSPLVELFGELRGKTYTEKLFNPDTGAPDGVVEHPVQPTFIAAMHSAPMVDFSSCKLKECKPEMPVEDTEAARAYDFGDAWKHALASYSAACQQYLADLDPVEADDALAEEATAGAGAGESKGPEGGAGAGAGDSKAAEGDKKSEDAEEFGAEGALLLHLYWRLGREAGAVKRTMQDNDISWGYYLDHLPEPHNNSHPNNFVVLPPSAEDRGPLLAPVDLDMAFVRKSYMDNSTGDVDDEGFSSALRNEYKAMKENLGGSTATTGLLDMEGGKGLSEAHQIIRWALRDTLVSGYDNAYNKRVDPHPSTAAMDTACHALIKLALIAACGRNS